MATAQPEAAPRYRSGLERELADQLSAAGQAVHYETVKLRYEVPASMHTYTPDFVLSNGIIIEAKGQFPLEDRRKMLLVRAQHPELDIRFVFWNARARLARSSLTTNASWCEKHGFAYAHRKLPEEWLREAPS